MALRRSIWAPTCLEFSLILVVLSAMAGASHLTTYGTNEKHCQPTFDRFRETVKQVPFPDDWTVVLVCTDVAWQVVLLQTHSEGLTEMAFTNFKHKWTLINAAVWDPMKNRSRWTPEMVLRHEFGHIRCECHDEERADQAGRGRE